EVQPDLTKAEAQDLGVTEVVSEYTTEFPHAEYRNVNIGRAAELMQNTLVQPGETFSLNDTVGERTEANGFTSGTIISEGQFTEALGGGVSQVATTAYNAGFFAGLKDVEHQPHSFYIDRYPEGREATVAWPYLDMAFQNDTDYGVLVDTSFSESSPGSSGSITVRLWSTKHRDVETSTSDRSAITDYEQVTESGEDCVPQQGTNGFDVTVNRVIRENGSVIADEDIHTTYNPAAAITCQ
ncbi:MAG TPA: VanW family protein, partial [Jiangellaceae bacterium]|nr:VanW family protein [Jiangellaceae bacterium]